MKIGIVHFRVGKTDGVSLEIMKRQQVLAKLGHTVRLISGTESTGSDYCLPNLEYDQEKIVKIKNNAFFEMQDYDNSKELLQDITEIAQSIERQFKAIAEQEQFDCIFVHNIFSHILHLPAALACADYLSSSNLSAVAVHHDFYWDGPNATTFQPTSKEIKDFIKQYLPPKLPNLKHVVINSINQDLLTKKSGLESTIIPDMFDFKQPAWQIDDFNKTLPEDIGFKNNDLIILQATRVVERKAIELAIDLVTQLSQRKNDLVGHSLYNGKQITQDSDVVLILAGYAEGFALPYRKKLEELIRAAGIKAFFIDKHIDIDRSTTDSKKIYSLWDTYAHADLVTYPSIWEGWGNQFIEAIFAKKPVAIFEYPVFKSDIKPEGYSVISFGDVLAEDRPDHLVQIPANHLLGTVEQTINTLLSQTTVEKLEVNYALGRANHSHKKLKELLQELLPH